MSRLPLAVLLAALALGAGACSDDTEPATDSTSETTTPSAGVEPTTSEASTPSSSPTVAPPPSEPPAPPPSSEPSQEPDPSSVPTTYAAAQARFDALGQEPQELSRFETTTGIYCLLDSDFVIGCELPSGGISDPAYCGDGPSQNVGRIELGEGDPQAVCNSDTIREPGAPSLELDSVAASSATGVQCLAQADGVTCLDPERSRGFFLGPDEYAVFTG